MIANREVYGQTLVEMGKTNSKIVVLDADLAKATSTEIYHTAYPERCIDCGSAEQNMRAVAAGLATCGFIPFVSSFAMFAALRAGEQFRNSICYPHLNVKVVATHAGLDCGADGATHQALEDLALMRAIPGNTVLVPSDPVSTRALLKLATSFNGPCYVRIGRDKCEELYAEDTEFAIGKSAVLKDGKDVSLITCGSATKHVLKAAKELESLGISAKVIDMYSLKPLDEEAIIEASKLGTIVTVEDHQTVGGLGSAVCEVVAQKAPCKVKVMGVNDIFGRSGNADELFAYYGIDTKTIVSTVKAMLQA